MREFSREAAMHSPIRRKLFKAAGALALTAAWPPLLRATVDLPIADSHSHIGLHLQGGYRGSLKEDMQAAGVMLLAWTIVGDGRWTVRTNQGIVQRSAPLRGDQSRYVRQKFEDMKRYLARNDLAIVEKPADIEAARSGAPRVVIAVEGAGFTEDGPELIDAFYAQGLRHLQLVHYVRNGIGDFQTERPEHNGMTALGVDTVKACNRLGILVDLAHATQPVIDRALETSSTPIIWSHSMLSTNQTSWTQSAGQARRLYIDYAKKIAQRGGAVGLWSSRGPGVRNVDDYAGELMRMADAIGPEHVMLGTDTDGLGPGGGVIKDLADLRGVGDALRKRGADDKTLNAICFENYARCLRGAIEKRQA